MRIFQSSSSSTNSRNLTDTTRGGSSIGSLKQDERWTLTQTGNWDLHRLDLNGDGDFIDTGELDDRGTFNVVNELTARDTDDDTNDDFTLTYDAAVRRRGPSPTRSRSSPRPNLAALPRGADPRRTPGPSRRML